MSIMTRRAAFALVPLAGAVLAGCQTTKPKSAGDMSADDSQFVADAFNIIEFDRQECTIAQAQARSPEVRAVAAELLQQANDFDAKLRPIAASAGVIPPTVLRTNLRVRAARLRLGQGFDLDKSFLEDQIYSHQDALNLQQTIVGAPGSNAQLQDLSKQGTSILEANLVKLREIQARVVRMR